MTTQWKMYDNDAHIQVVDENGITQFYVNKKAYTNHDDNLKEIVREFISHYVPKDVEVLHIRDAEL